MKGVTLPCSLIESLRPTQKDTFLYSDEKWKVLDEIKAPVPNSESWGTYEALYKALPVIDLSLYTIQNPKYAFHVGLNEVTHWATISRKGKVDWVWITYFFVDYLTSGDAVHLGSSLSRIAATYYWKEIRPYQKKRVPEGTPLSSTDSSFIAPSIRTCGQTDELSCQNMYVKGEQNENIPGGFLSPMRKERLGFLHNLQADNKENKSLFATTLSPFMNRRVIVLVSHPIPCTPNPQHSRENEIKIRSNDQGYNIYRFVSERIAIMNYPLDPAFDDQKKPPEKKSIFNLFKSKVSETESTGKSTA